MEQSSNLPVVAKRIWNIVRVMFFMLRKSISKRKLMIDLNMQLIMKRGKIVAGKAIHDLMFHHHHHSNDGPASPSPGDYEFSCSNSPAFPFHLTKRNKQPNFYFFPCAQAPPTDDDDVTASAVKKALEMLNGDAAPEFWHSALSSPVLPRFGTTPAVRQVRITDSPFPLRDAEEDCQVDQAAEEFIMKFYRDLRKQRSIKYE